jgi:Spy/CpxP family protein refolding chaperone
MAMSAAPAAAQGGTGGGRGLGAAMRGEGPGVESVMRMRDRLELTDEQIERLDAIRQEAVERRTAHQAQMAELRSQVLAGEMTREELREQVEARWEASEQVREAQRARVDEVLTDAQREELEELGAQARAFRMGRRSGLRQGRGVRTGGQGFAPGMRGPGARGQRFMPGDGPRFERGMPGRMPMRGRGWAWDDLPPAGSGGA